MIILPTCYNIFIYNELRCFFRLCRLSHRHAITLWRVMRYGVFSGPDGYPTDMRNTNRRFDLWQIPSSDYPADMRKSIRDKEIWPSARFPMRGGACARSLVVSPSNCRYLDRAYFPWRTQSFYSFRCVASVDELIRAGPLTSWQNSRSVRLKRSGADPGRS